MSEPSPVRLADVLSWRTNRPKTFSLETNRPEINCPETNRPMTNRPMTFSSLNWGKKWVSLFPNKLGKNHICLSTLSQSAQKTQIAQFFCALWVKAHSARGGRGVNRKHHPAESCDLRFGFQSARKIFQSARKNFPCALRKNLKTLLSVGWCLHYNVQLLFYHCC